MAGKGGTLTSLSSSDSVGGESERTRRPRGRIPTLSGVHLLILATGTLAFIANLALLRSGDAPRARVAVSQVDLAPGRRLQPEDIRPTPIDVEDSVASRLLSDGEWADFGGWVVTERIAAGSLISKADLRAPPAEPNLRAMSLPIEVEHAVGGDLIAGDLVDVIRVDRDRARFVATGLKVLETGGVSEGSLRLGGDFYLVLAVDDQTALALALAGANAQVEVVRSTGSRPVSITSLEETRQSFQEIGAADRWEPGGERLGSVSQDTAPQLP